MAFSKKFGRLPSARDSRQLHLRRYLVPGKLPPLQREAINSAAFGAACGMLANDTIGDCVVAAAMHLDQDWTANAGRKITFTNSQAIATYSAVTGYNPTDSSTDRGTSPVAFLKFWRNSGLIGRTLGAWASIQPEDLQDVLYTIQLFGGVFAGFNLPNSALDRDDWDYTPDPALTIDDLPNRANGHMVHIVDFLADPIRFKVRTWGQTIAMSPAFLGAYCDEAYACLSQQMLLADGRSPQGLDLAALQMDLRRVALV